MPQMLPNIGKLISLKIIYILSDNKQKSSNKHNTTIATTRSHFL